MSREIKDSQIDIIKSIPVDWRTQRLKFICSITTGDGDTQDAEANGVYPFYVRSPIVEKSTRYTFDGEGILMAGDGAGAGRIFHHAYGKYAVHQRVYRLYDIRDINSDYLFYSMCSLFPNEMDKGSAQSTVPSVRLPMLKDFNVCLPSDEEQECIVSYLDSKCTAIDEAIERHKKIIEKLEEYKRAFIIAMVSGKPDHDVRKSEIPWMPTVPSGWDIIPLRFALRPRKNKNDGMAEDNLLTLSYGKIKRKSIDSNEGLLPASFEGYNIVEAGDIVLRLLDLQNDKHSLRTGLVTERGIITSAYITVTPSSRFVPAFMRYLLHAYDLMKVFYSMGEGVRQGLSYDDLGRNLLVPCPPKNVQEDIATEIEKLENKVDAAIEKQEFIIAKLEEYRKSIIYNAVTGKIDCCIGASS